MSYHTVGHRVGGCASLRVCAIVSTGDMAATSPLLLAGTLLLAALLAFLLLRKPGGAPPRLPAPASQDGATAPVAPRPPRHPSLSRHHAAPKPPLTPDSPPRRPAQRRRRRWQRGGGARGVREQRDGDALLRDADRHSREVRQAAGGCVPAELRRAGCAGRARHLTVRLFERCDASVGSASAPPDAAALLPAEIGRRYPLTARAVVKARPSPTAAPPPPQPLTPLPLRTWTVCPSTTLWAPSGQPE